MNGECDAMPAHQWVYNARIVRVIDADSLQVELDGGFHNVQSERLRLWGIDAPEVVGATRAAGLAATEWVRAWVGDSAGDWPFRVRTIKGRDSFGRYLALCWRREDGACLNADLLRDGFATEDRR